MRRLALSLLLPLLLRADFSSPRWRCRRPVAVAVAGQVAAVRIDGGIYGKARPDLADLRIVHNGAEAPCVLARGPEREILAAPAPARREDTATQSTLLLIDFGAAGVPHDLVHIETDAGFFERALDVESSADGTRWQTVARRSIYRLPGDESLTVPFPEQHDRYLRLRIYNRDDRPIPVRAVQIEALETRVEFLPPAAGEYWLYYGNPGAKKPAYDLAKILERQSAPVAELRPGAEQLNPDYRPVPPPWTERHPAILYAALAAAVIGLGFVVVRFWLLLRSEARRKAGN